MKTWHRLLRFFRMLIYGREAVRREELLKIKDESQEKVKSLLLQYIEVLRKRGYRERRIKRKIKQKFGV
jgi:hypothetical protein